MTRTAAHKQMKVQGIRIASSGSRTVSVDQYDIIKVPLSHDIFDYGEICPVSELVGMPLLVLKLQSYFPDQNSSRSKVAKRHYRNKAVDQLMICCDPEVATMPGEGLCQTSPDWTNAGNVMLVREDKKELYPHHIKLLLKFIATITCEATTTKMSHGREYTPEDAVMLFTPGDWKDFYMMERHYWLHCPDMASMLSLPSPFSRPAGGKHFSEHCRVRHVWMWLSLDEKYKRAATWKERHLIARLIQIKGAHHT
ncbi:hypothetical protein LTR56_014860 [Elasticomyces elasticus]|nr:hypothetical protein LTR56_014860 [Elasticomyces elasticus]KAK3644682.1 hypothetical protein LTR22_015057 [Elasticomyces elasticus]KAK4916067.1 hypothetical protein LTR49_015841 [Elasticomyces elasticus]KAK5755193.1 hypothetical protein LTS12_014757 [Elasticomyces elasticus]